MKSRAKLEDVYKSKLSWLDKVDFFRNVMSGMGSSLNLISKYKLFITIYNFKLSSAIRDQSLPLAMFKGAIRKELLTPLLSKL